MTDELDTGGLVLTHRAPLEFRSARTVDVRFPERIITIVCVPYDEETAVWHKGKWIAESFAPGSFDGVERRANRVKVNREHNILDTIGRAVAFHPSRSEGLVADLKIGRTQLADESLELASEGALDASVAFAPMPGHEHWTENRTKRRFTKAFLGHVALTADPAYEGAQVLAVRSVPGSLDVVEAPRPATPNLDMVLAERALRDYSPR